MGIPLKTVVAGLQDDFAIRVVVLALVCAHLGISITFTSGRRSRAKQQQLYNAFIAGRSKLPAAPPGRSLHEYGLAVDLVTAPKDRATVVDLAQAFGMRWGGERDPVHFELAGAKA